MGASHGSECPDSTGPSLIGLYLSVYLFIGLGTGEMISDRPEIFLNVANERTCSELYRRYIDDCAPSSTRGELINL